jgi:hypothetical protein
MLKLMASSRASPLPQGFMFDMKPARLICQSIWPEWVLYSHRWLVKIPLSFSDP